MAGTWHMFGLAVEKMNEGSIDIDTDTFKMLLTTSAYTPDQDLHDFRDDVTNEVVGTAYVAGGATLAGGTFAYDGASNEYRIAWTSPTWAVSTITARTAVIYKSRGGAASADELLAYCTESGDITSTADTFTVTLPSPTIKYTVS